MKRWRVLATRRSRVEDDLFFVVLDGHPTVDVRDGEDVWHVNDMKGSSDSASVFVILEKRKNKKKKGYKYKATFSGPKEKIENMLYNLGASSPEHKDIIEK